MIEFLAADLLAKIRTVPAVANATSLTVGGRKSDPGLTKIPLPVAWVTYAKDQVDEPERELGPSSGLIPVAQVLMETFSVHIFIDYSTDDDLLQNGYPLLEAVKNAVHGSDTPGGYRWRYAGQKITLIYPDRLGYEQRYTTTAIVS